MLFDLVETLHKKRRLLLVAAFIALDVWLLTFCTHALQTHRSDITARIHTTQQAQSPPVYQSELLLDGSRIIANLAHAASVAEVSALRATVAATDGIIKAEASLQAAGKATAHTASSITADAIQVSDDITNFKLRVASLPFVFASHGVEGAFDATSKLGDMRLASVIQPKKNLAVPVITAEQAKQAKLIQDGTFKFEPVKLAGSGGACDNGAGNGGYPMDWCDAPMDSIRTVSYSTDRINRECTSYAYWYFATVEGHTDFRVTGNANRWAATSNYPTHATPAVGAIAVETAGAYGHVAIVQALPGQTYEGKVVPDGYVLVSEMNYDWRGHFRYSYSPVGKFEAYIYP